MLSKTFLATFGLLTLATGQYGQGGEQLETDPQTYGPELEVVYLYRGQWPTGIAVSSKGRLFSNYPPGLDPNNTNNGSNGKYTIAELTEHGDVPFPSVEYNNPPGGAINYSVTPAVGANYENHFIGSQSIVIDSADRAWVLDTGRALTPEGVLVPASVGGPKLVQINLNNNTVVQTIIFPNTVAYPDSYLNDVRFDLRPSITESGKGVAFITDSSTEGRWGIIIVDLGTGKSWRHLDGHSSVAPQDQFVASVWGTSLYAIPGPGMPLRSVPFGSDGIALSADGERLFWGAVASRYLYSASTAALRKNDQTSDLLVQQSVTNHGERGLSDGFETDSNGIIYTGNMEQNAINLYNPANGTVQTFVRDPRINWVDTMSVATDGYLYFTNNQLWRMASFFPGTDRRVLPYALYKTKLPGNGTKVIPGH